MNQPIWYVLGVIIAAHLAVDLLAPLVLYRERDTLWLAFIPIGVCVSQVNLIAFWAVFAPGAVTWRFPWALFLGMLMWGTLVIANRAAQPSWGSFDRGDALQLGAVLLGGVFVAQIPYWLLRLALHFRLYPPNLVAGDDNQFNLRQLLIGIALCCLALGVMQGVLPAGETRMTLDREFHVILPVIAVANLLLMLPCLWFTLTMAPRYGALLAAALGGGVMLVTVLEHGILTALFGGLLNNELLIGLLGFNFAQVTSLAVTLAVLRASGFAWRMQRRAVEPTILSADEPAVAEPASAQPYVHPLDSP